MVNRRGRREEVGREREREILTPDMSSTLRYEGLSLSLRMADTLSSPSVASRLAPPLSHRTAATEQAAVCREWRPVGGRMRNIYIPYLLENSVSILHTEEY